MDFKEYLELAESGDEAAMYYVGSSYYDGTAQGDNREFTDKARYWLEKCSAAGKNAHAMRKCGICYENDGRHTEAIAMYRAAADLGDAESMYRIAEYYTSDEGAFEGLADTLADKAKELYLSAYRGGCTDARSSLLRMGIDVSDIKDIPNLVINDLLFDVSYGLMEAEFELGHLYIREDLGYNMFSEAIMLFRRAHERGHSASTYFIGYMYEHGLGVAKDKEEALKWYSIAAAGGMRGRDYSKNAADAYNKLLSKIRR
jgi:TPR repeat protein